MAVTLSGSIGRPIVGTNNSIRRFIIGIQRFIYCAVVVSIDILLDILLSAMTSFCYIPVEDFA